MKKIKIGILTFPINGAGIIPTSNLVEILFALTNELYLITGNECYTVLKDNKKIHTYGIKHERSANFFVRIADYIYTQFKISYNVALISNKLDIWIFTIGGDTLLIPMLTAKLFRKPVIIAFAGSSVQTLESANDYLFRPMKILSSVNCALSNRIFLYSENLINSWNLKKFKKKISIIYEHFIDFNTFKIKKKIDIRANLVGYVGRLSEEKGTMNFVQAIPKLLEEKTEIEFLVIGDGQLRDEIEKYILNKNIYNYVKLLGWFSHDELPDYLNKLKLVVLPSYTEGLPNLMLEAMACGTPVLATAVGAIPDIIKDGETGFIMENNSSACIAENVMRALEHPDLETIAENARALVEREFTYEVAVDRWKNIMEAV